jgi:hypothetical protein
MSMIEKEELAAKAKLKAEQSKKKRTKPRGFRGICPSSGRFAQSNMQLRQVFVAASLGE